MHANLLVCVCIKSASALFHSRHTYSCTLMRICSFCNCCTSGVHCKASDIKTTTRLISVTQLLAEPSDCWFYLLQHTPSQWESVTPPPPPPLPPHSCWLRAHSPLPSLSHPPLDDSNSYSHGGDTSRTQVSVFKFLPIHFIVSTEHNRITNNSFLCFLCYYSFTLLWWMIWGKPKQEHSWYILSAVNIIEYNTIRNTFLISLPPQQFYIKYFQENNLKWIYFKRKKKKKRTLKLSFF